MKRRKIIALLLSLLLITISTAACGNQNGDELAHDDDATGVEGDGEYRIGMMVKNRINPYFLEQERGAVEAAERLGIDLVVLATETDDDVERQIQIAEDLLAQEYDALIIPPLSSTSIVQFIKQCNDAGVPFINSDTRADEELMEEIGAESVFYVGADNYDAGYVAAEGIIEAINGSGKVAILEGTSGADSAEQRLEGFLDKISEYPDIEIIASQPANYNRSMGYDVFQNMLQANPEMDALFAANDEMALGAVEVLEALGQSGDIPIIGINYVDEARDAIEAGRMYGSVTQAPYDMGRIALEQTIEYLKGNPVEDEYITESVLHTIDNL